METLRGPRSTKPNAGTLIHIKALPAARLQLSTSMKTKLTQILVTLSALGLLAACNKATESVSTATEKTSVNTTSAAQAPDPNLPEKSVQIAGNDQMKFDVTAIEAKAGQKVTVTLKNAGTMPKVSMGHNFVLLAPDVDPA